MTDSVISPEFGGGEYPSISDFDPVEGVLPESIAPVGGTTGSVVLLVDVAGDRDWADHAAVAIATAWARSGQRVVLADLHLEDPRLHSLLGESNLDGVTDIFLYGSSLARSAKPIPGRDFYLLTAGTYTPDPDEILRHPRWEKLIAGFAEAGACFVLYLPGKDVELAPLGRWGGEVVLLGELESVRDVAVPPPMRIRAVLSPPQPLELEEEEVAPWSAEAEDPWEERDLDLVGPESSQELEEPSRELEEAVFAAREPEVDVEPVSRGEDLAAPPVEEPSAEPAITTSEPELEEPPVISPEARRRRRTERTRVSPVLLVLLVLVVGAGAYILLSSNPELLSGLGGGEEAGAEATVVAAPAPPPPPTPAGEPLPYAVPVAAFPALDPARALADANAAQFGVPMYVVPELIQGVQYYRVLAGLPHDTAAAAVLRQRLVDAGVIEPRDALGELERVRSARLAFDLGEYPTRAAAEARADTLVTAGIPAYPVVLPYSDGTERWRLYGGAYADSAEAEAMRQLLASAELPTRLVPRVGGEPAAAQ